MSQKQRLLTDEEIDSILSFIKPSKHIPPESAISLAQINKQRLRKQLEGQLIYPNVIPTLRKTMKKMYETTQIQAGESVGIVTAQSIGEKQTQATLNSVDWTDVVLYTKDDKAVVEPIGQMVDRLMKEDEKNIKLYQKNKTEYLELPEGYYIPSTDEDGFNKWLRIEAVTRHLPGGQLVKVTTQSGRTVMASQCKSFLVWNGSTFEPTLGSDVKIGDILPTTKQLTVKTTVDYLDLLPIFPKDKYLYSCEIVKARECKEKYPRDWFSNHHKKDFTTPYNRGDCLFGKRKDFYMNVKAGFVYIHTSNEIVSHMPDKIPLDNDFGFLVGIYLAEGLTTTTYVNIANNDPIIRGRVSKWCDRHGITYRTIVNDTKLGVGYGITIHSTLLARLLKSICNTGSSDKIVPMCAYTAPEEFIKGLLDGYFSGDGTVNFGYGTVNCSSASKTLIVGIAFLLTYFEIFGRIGGHQPKKNNLKTKNIKYVNTLSIRNIFAKNFAKHISMTEGEKQKKLNEFILNRHYMYDYGRFMEDLPFERDVYFDRVVEIEHVEATTGLVYDFTIAKTRNFQLFNGLNIRDSFHKAGSAENDVDLVSKFSELLNATKAPKSQSCFIYFSAGNSTIEELRKTIGSSLVELTMTKISKNFKVNVDKEDESWYIPYELLIDNSFRDYTDCISIEINTDILFTYKLTLQDVADKLTSNYSDMACVCSPENFGRIDVFVDTRNIDLPEERLAFIDHDNVREIYLEEVVQPIIEKIMVAGIPKINQIFFNKDEKGGWMIETNGSNFPALLAHPKVDMKRVVSNNVWDIYDALGVEAARQFMIDQFSSIMPGINTCHIMLLVDKMTYKGGIASISRYTKRTDEGGVLAKSTFEESLQHLLSAGIYGHHEPVHGVSASIICGKQSNVGTGVCKIKMNLEMIQQS